jgi:hypothetical protein
MTDPVVHIQVDPADSPSMPSWFEEVVVVTHALQRHGSLKAIEERVRFVRARMGKYELIDFGAMRKSHILEWVVTNYLRQVSKPVSTPCMRSW